MEFKKKLVMVRLKHFALGCVATVLLRRNIRVNLRHCEESSFKKLIRVPSSNEDQSH